MGCVECREAERSAQSDARSFSPWKIVNEKTHKRLPDGELGLLVLTHLNRRGTVVIRYAIGDLTSMTHEQCPHCGRTSERIVSNPIRIGELTKVRGMLVNKETLEEQLTLIPEIDEFQAVITKTDPQDLYSMDEILVKAATKTGDKLALERIIVNKIKEVIGVKPRVEFMERDQIYDGQKMKMTRVVDVREKTSG